MFRSPHYQEEAVGRGEAMWVSMCPACPAVLLPQLHSLRATNVGGKGDLQHSLRDQGLGAFLAPMECSSQSTPPL